MFNNTSDICNKLLVDYDLQHTSFLDDKKIKMLSKDNFRDFLIDTAMIIGLMNQMIKN